MLTFPPYPIPVHTELGEGYVLYIQSSGMLENDIFTCVLCDGGEIKHFLSNQVRVYKNLTFDIKEKK